MKREKLNGRLLAFFLVLGLVFLAACGSNGAPSAEQNPPAEESPSEQPSEQSEQKPEEQPSVVTEPMNLTMAAGSAGGASQAIGEAIGEAIKRTVPGTSFTYQPSKYGANPPLVGEGNAELGMDAGDFPYWAYNGMEIYPKAYPNLRVIAFLHDTAWSMGIRKDTGITSIQEIVDKKFPLKLSVNTKNGLIEYPNRWVFAEYGFSYEDVEQWGGTVNFSAGGEAANLFKDRQLDAVAWQAQQPLSVFLDIYKAVPVTWLEPSPEVVKNVIEKHPSARPYTIPQSMYADLGMTEDYETFSMPMFLIASTEMTNSEAYTIAKAIYDNIDYLQTASDVYKDLSKETIVPQAGIPIHPGAEAFYREVGLIQ